MGEIVKIELDNDIDHSIIQRMAKTMSYSGSPIIKELNNKSVFVHVGCGALLFACGKVTLAWW